MNSSPFILPRAGAPKGPPGFPPDVAPNQIIAAAHINAIRDSVAIWPGNVDGNAKTLANVAALGIGTASPSAKLDVNGALRSIGSAVPSSGAGLEILYGTLGVIQAYDRTAAQYKTLSLESELLTINGNSGGRVQIGANLGGNLGSVDVHKGTGVDNYIRVHSGNVYELRFGLAASGDAYIVSPNVTGTFYCGTQGSGAVNIITSGANRLWITAAGAITMGNGAANAVAVTGDLTVSTKLGVGVTSSTHPLYVRTAADLNLRIGSFSGTHVLIETSNDAGSANTPLFFAATLFRMGGGPLAVDSMPAANPGAGTKQLWYDPADGNRVKFAP
jgi:hypothetical protein